MTPQMGIYTREDAIADIIARGRRKLMPALTRYVLPGWTVDFVSTEAITADLIYYIPIFVEETTTYIRIGLEVTIGAAGTADLRIFAWNNGVTGALIASCGTVDTTAAAVKEITIAQQLQAKTHYFLAVRYSAIVTVRAPSETNCITCPVSGVSATASFVQSPILTVAAAYADPAPAPTGLAPIEFAHVFLREN